VTGQVAMYWIGTSGYNYLEWRGSFYPDHLSPKGMLAFYAARFRTVEINYTFYRLPTERVLAGWAAQTPDPFRLTLKAPRRITHDARLRDVAPAVATFCALAGTLHDKAGVLLFQLPPTLRKDLVLLDAFLAGLPPGTRAAVEFRHLSWLGDDVFDRLRAAGVALCVADSGTMTTPVVTTADHAYFRLRDEGYTARDLARWAETIQAEAARARDVFVYFKHEESGKGPELAAALAALLDCA
jgi:uncharacterized protein YecE (DUF72 family)